MFLIYFPYIFASFCYVLLHFPRFFHPRGPVNTAQWSSRSTVLACTPTISWPLEGYRALFLIKPYGKSGPSARGGPKIGPKKGINKANKDFSPICSPTILVLKLDFLAFPQGPGGFREVREAGRNHFHLSWYLLVSGVTSYDQKGIE